MPLKKETRNLYIANIFCDMYNRHPDKNTPFPGLLHFTLDTYLILLSVKQGGNKYHF